MIKTLGNSTLIQAGLSMHFKHIADGICASSGGTWRSPTYLGAGASAEVYAVQSANGPAALKVYDPEFFKGDAQVVEADRIRRQQELIGHEHNNLVKIVGAYEYSAMRTWYILMEYLPWSDMKDALREIPASSVRPLIRQLVSAVQWLEERGLYHRDIKPANIAVDVAAVRLKLLDLGVMRQAAPSEFGTDLNGKRRFVATVQYSSPEYLVRKDWSDNDEILKALSIYQVGATLHDLIMKRPIFSEHVAFENKYALAKAVEEEIPCIRSTEVGHDLVQLANDCLLKDPRERLRRVNWDRFFENPDSLDAARTRLRANAQAQRLPSGNLIRVRTEDAARRLLDAAVRALQAEQGIFPPHTTKIHTLAPGKASLSIILSIREGMAAGVEFRFNITLVIQRGSAERFDLYLEGEIAALNVPYNSATTEVPLLSDTVDGLCDLNALEVLGSCFVRLFDRAQARLTELEAEPNNFSESEYLR